MNMTPLGILPSKENMSYIQTKGMLTWCPVLLFAKGHPLELQEFTHLVRVLFEINFRLDSWKNFGWEINFFVPHSLSSSTIEFPQKFSPSSLTTHNCENLTLMGIFIILKLMI